jgi:hypothetical protein
VTRNGIEFAKRVGIVSSAILLVSGVLTLFWTFAVAHLITPIMDRKIAEEREARVRAQSMLAEKLSELSKDRIVLLAVIETPQGSERRKLVESIRQQWLR